MTSLSPPPIAKRIAWVVVPCGCRLIVAAVFLMAALTKITDLGGFAEQVRLHADLPSWLEPAVIHVLPWLELVCGAALAIGYCQREAALLATVLLLAFLIYALWHHGERPCGCFLIARLPMPPWWQSARNALLLGLAMVALCAGPRRQPHVAESCR